jgi:hypothetical protein
MWARIGGGGGGGGNTNSFTGEFTPNFDLKNMISTYTNDFSWKKMAQIRQMFKKFFSNRQIFMISSSRQSKIFFLPSYLIHSQIWLNYFSCHFGYITKSLKETLEGKRKPRK